MYIYMYIYIYISKYPFKEGTSTETKTAEELEEHLASNVPRRSSCCNELKTSRCRGDYVNGLV